MPGRMSKDMSKKVSDQIECLRECQKICRKKISGWMADRLSEDRSNRMSACGVKEKQTRYLTASGGDHSKKVYFFICVFHPSLNWFSGENQGWKLMVLPARPTHIIGVSRLIYPSESGVARLIYPSKSVRGTCSDLVPRDLLIDVPSSTASHVHYAMAFQGGICWHWQHVLELNGARDMQSPLCCSAGAPVVGCMQMKHWMTMKLAVLIMKHLTPNCQKHHMFL